MPCSALHASAGQSGCVTIVLALCADLVFGLGVALQQRAALEVPEEHALRPGLLVRLAKRPLWLLGLACEIGGFALHAAALARGSLVLVQPLLTLDLVFTLAIGAAWTHTRLSRRDWFGVACTIIGVVGVHGRGSSNEREQRHRRTRRGGCCARCG